MEHWTVLSTESPTAKERADALLGLQQHSALTGWQPDEPFGDQAAREVVAALHHEDSSAEVRRAAIRVAELVSRTDPESIVPHSGHVAKSLSDEDAHVRRWAAVAFTGMAQSCPDHPQVCSHLGQVHRAVRDSDSAVRYLAVGALARMGDEAAGLADMHAASVADALVSDDDVDVRRAAAFALSHLDEAAITYTPKLVEALKDEDVDVRRLAANTLERCAEHASSFCQELVEALQDEDVIVRRWIARCLEHVARTRHASQYAKEIAGSLLRDPDPWVRMWVLLALARFGRDAAHTLQEVTHSCCDTSCLPVQCLAVGTMAQFGDNAKWFACQHVGAISLALQSDDEEVRRVGSLAMALLGEASTLPMSSPLSALKDSDAHVRRGAARALEQRSLSKDELKHAVCALHDEDVAVRLSAVRMLGNMDAAAEDYAEEVDQVLRGTDHHQQRLGRHASLKLHAIKALPNMGTKGERLMNQYRMEQEAEQVQTDALSTCRRAIKENCFEFWTYMRKKATQYKEKRKKAKSQERHSDGKSARRVSSSFMASSFESRVISWSTSPSDRHLTSAH